MMDTAIVIIIIEACIIWGLVLALRTQVDNNKFWSRQYDDMKDRYFEILDKVTDKWQ